ncbi:MAG: hypothetical protein FJ014_04205 [Chloroflexi bacterium]|nr:hypothetical protein [Chloroflexota bacterium]
MSQTETISSYDIYGKLLDLERSVRELRMLFLATKPPAERICRHPVSLEGIWAGANITDEDIEAAKRSMFAYQHEDRDH